MSFLKKIAIITLCICGISYYNISSATHINNNYNSYNNVKHNKSHYKTIKYENNKTRFNNYYNQKEIDWNNCYKKLMEEHDNLVENDIKNKFMNNIGNRVLRDIDKNIFKRNFTTSEDNNKNFKLLKKVLDEQVILINDYNEYCMLYSLDHKYFGNIINKLIEYHEIIVDLYWSCNYYEVRLKSLDETLDNFLKASYDFCNKIMTFRYLREKYNMQLFDLAKIFYLQWEVFFGRSPYYKMSSAK